MLDINWICMCIFVFVSAPAEFSNILIWTISKRLIIHISIILHIIVINMRSKMSSIYSLQFECVLQFTFIEKFWILLFENNSNLHWLFMSFQIDHYRIQMLALFCFCYQFLFFFSMYRCIFNVVLLLLERSQMISRHYILISMSKLC